MKSDREGPSASFVRKMLFEVGRASAEEIAQGRPRGEVLEDVSQVLLETLGKNVLGPFPAIAPSFALAWAESGFPTIEPSHRLAASLMATSVPEEHVDEFVRMPWRCFGFHIPDGLVSRGDGVARLVHYAKTMGTAIWIIGHVTGDSDIAGPRQIEHDVDVVLKLALGKRLDGTERILKCHKNRFGPANAVGHFELTVKGFVPVDAHG